MADKSESADEQLTTMNRQEQRHSCFHVLFCDIGRASFWMNWQCFSPAWPTAAGDAAPTLVPGYPSQLSSGMTTCIS
jgi:hypothetical protein